MKRGWGIVLVIAFIFATGFVISLPSTSPILNDLHLNIQTTNSSGNVINGTFSFVFSISTTSDCSNIIYTNSTNLTTDSNGGISYYLSNLSLNFLYQYWLCYYRNGVLINASEISQVPYAFMARNVSLSGIYVDTNFGVGNYNITTTGFIGIGTTSPSYLLEINYSSLTSIGESITNSLNYGTAGAILMLKTANGSALTSGSRIGGIIFTSLINISNSVNSAGITSYADDNWNDTSAPANLRFETTPNASITRTERMRITSAGYVGIGTITPTQKLDVAGNVNITSGGNISFGKGGYMYDNGTALILGHS